MPYTDIGEPCSVELDDGRIVTVYYWANGAADPMRYLEAAIYELAPNARHSVKSVQGRRERLLDGPDGLGHPT